MNRICNISRPALWCSKGTAHCAPLQGVGESQCIERVCAELTSLPTALSPPSQGRIAQRRLDDCARAAVTPPAMVIYAGGVRRSNMRCSNIIVDIHSVRFVHSRQGGLARASTAPGTCWPMKQRSTCSHVPPTRASHSADSGTGTRSSAWWCVLQC